MSSPGFTYRQDANGASPVKLFRQDVASTQNSHAQLYSDMYTRSPQGPQQHRSPPPPAGHGTDSPIAWLDDVEQKLRTVQTSNSRAQSPHRPASPLVVGFLKSPSRDTSSRGTPPRGTPTQPLRRSPPPRISPPKSSHTYPPPPLPPLEATYRRDKEHHGEGIGGGIDLRTTRPHGAAPSTTSSRPPSPRGGTGGGGAGGGAIAASTRWVDDLELFVASGGDGAKWLAAASDQRSPSRHHDSAAAAATGYHHDSVNARAADVLRHPPSPPPRSSIGDVGGSGSSSSNGRMHHGGQHHRPEAVAEATRALEYELRQLDADFTQVRSYGGYGSDAGLLSMPSRRSDALDLGSSSLYNGKNNSGSTSNAPIFDHGTSRAVAAALGALQRKQQQLNDELAEKRAVVKQLEESLASATSASRDEDAALHQANLNEQSRSAVQVAVLEGEVERLQREATALKDALTVLEAEDAAAAGEVALAGDRAQLAEERASVQAQKVKEAQEEYDAASAALAQTQQQAAAASHFNATAAGSDTQHLQASINPSGAAAVGSTSAGRAVSSSSSTSSPAVALEARVAAAENARDQAAAERSALEGKVVDTNRRLDVALSHLEELVKLMGDEKHKVEIAEQLGKVRWRAAWRNNQNDNDNNQQQHHGGRTGGGSQQQDTARKAAAVRDADAAAETTAEARQRWQNATHPSVSSHHQPSFGFGGGGVGGGGVSQQDVLMGSAESRFQSAMSAVRDATKVHSSTGAAEPSSSSMVPHGALSPAVEAAQRAADAVAAAAQAAVGASSTLGGGDPYSSHQYNQDASAADAGHYAAASVAAAAAAAAASVAAAVTGEHKRSSPPLHHQHSLYNHGGEGGDNGHHVSDEVAADLSTVFHATTNHGYTLSGGGLGAGMAHHHAPSSSSWKPSSPGRYEGLSPTSSSSNGGVGGGGARAKSHEQLVGMVVSGGSPRGGGEHQQVQPWEEDDVALRQEAWGEVLAQQQKQSEQWQATLARQAELSQYWEEQLRNQAEMSRPPRKPKVTRKYRAQQKVVNRLATARSASPPGNACRDAESLAAAAWWTGRTRETDALAVAKARNAAVEVRRRHESTSGKGPTHKEGGRRSTAATTSGSTTTTRRRAASSSAKTTRRSTAADEPPSPSRRTSSRVHHSSTTSSSGGGLRAATAREFKEGAASYVPVKAKKVARSSDGLRVWHG